MITEEQAQNMLENFKKEILDVPKGPFSRRVHQLTLHGYTYPFVEKFWEAALPDPPPVELINKRSRRHSMLAAALLARKDDFLFFFQADPQDPNPKVDSRRGIRGVYNVADSLSWANHTSPLEHPIHGKSYNMHAMCPKCGCRFSTLYDPCPCCKAPLPATRFFRRTGQTLPEHILSLRIPVKPATVFEKEVADERAYGDMSFGGVVQRAIVWIGRHDNAMGEGKGSSVRQLLPEEAIRLYGLLLTEPGQKVKKLSGFPRPSSIAVRNKDGTDLRCILRDDRNPDLVKEEISLHTAVSLEVNDPKSQLYKLIRCTIPGLRDLWETHYLEYASSEFPWGYTGSTSDYVLVFRPRSGKPIRRAVVIEFKRDGVGINELAQAWLYMPWVAQLLGMHLAELAGEPGKVAEVHLTPVLVGKRLVNRGQNQIRGLPKGYDRTVKYYNGATVRHVVTQPIFWKYTLKECGKCAHTQSYRALVEFSHIHISPSLPNVFYIPSIGTSTAQAERERTAEELRRLAAHLSSLF